MDWFDYLKVVIIGIIEGVTEWLPVSSTGHMILAEKFIPLSMSEDFMEMFNVVIQLGAILAVVVSFFKKLNPFALSKDKEEKKDTWKLWGKIVIAVIPAGVTGVLLDDWFDEHLYNPVVVSIALIFYGLVFVLMETINRNRDFKIKKFSDMPIWVAFLIGCFQVLALVPGTSRSGVTIIGAMILGCSRFISAEFTFYMAIPVMAGASGLKVLKYFKAGNTFTSSEIIVLALGCAVAFVVSLFVIKFFMGYVKKKDFRFFGYYRIVLGSVILGILYSNVFAGIL
ncbi:MAG: undecaprenyl-diphosphate phosphatase [Lachnospiraceae bacterium]|nr:undecaprenyl-diphosphate phosphatase [Lachnospiraceae bacterium]